MLQYLFVVLFMISVLFLPASKAYSDEAPKNITIAYHNYSPYYDLDGIGMVADIYKLAFSRQGIDVVMRPYPIRRGIKKLFDQEVDAFSPGNLFIADKLLQKKLILVPAFIVNIGWLSKSDRDDQFIDDVEGKTLLTPRADFVDVYKKKGLVIKVVETPVRQIAMVMGGRADYSEFTVLAAWTAVYKNNKFDDEAVKFTKTIGELVGDLAFLKKNPRAKPLSDAFKLGMQSIINDGSYLAIHERYWGKGNVPKGVLFNELKSYGTDNFDHRKIAELMH